MLKSKAIDILKTFSKDEFKRFEDFVASPYFNKSKSLASLVSSLKKFSPEFNSEEMTEQYIYGKIFTNNKYSYSMMRNLMSELLQLCEKFILNDRLNKNLFSNPENLINLLEEYQYRGLENLFKIRFKKVEEEIENLGIDVELYRVLSRLEARKQEFEYSNYSWRQKLRESYFKSAEYDLCRISRLMFKNANSIYFSTINIGGEVNESLFFRLIKKINFQELLKELTPADTEEKFFIALNLKLLLLTTSKGSEKIFYEVKDSIFKNIDIFTNGERYTLLSVLRNYCRYKIDLNESSFKEELYQVNKMKLDKIDFSIDKLESALYNIYEETFAISVAKKDYEYAESFIEKYKDLLDPEIRDVVYGFVKAYLNFEYGKFEKTIEILSKIKIPNWHSYLRIKILYLKAYYELGYFDEAFTMLDALRHYINKEQKIAEDGKKQYNILFGIYHRIFKFKTEPQRYSRFEVNKLQEDINNFTIIAGKEWFIEKTNDLKKLVEK